VERLIARDDHGALDVRLRNQQPIERVAVVPWESLDRRGMVDGDRQGLRSSVQVGRGKVVWSFQLGQ